MTNKREKEYRKLVKAIDTMWDILKESMEEDGKNDVGYCGIENYTRHVETIKTLRRWLNDLSKVISSDHMKG